MPKGKIPTQSEMDTIRHLDEARAGELFNSVDEYCELLARVLERKKLSVKTLRKIRNSGYCEKKYRERNREIREVHQDAIFMLEKDSLDSLVSEAVRKVLEERGM